MFYSNLVSACEQRNTNVTEMAKTLSIPRPTVYSWKRNGYTPRPQVVSKIADYLEIKPETLTTKQPEPKQTKPRRPRVTENQITDIFNSLNPTGKRTLIARGKELAQLKAYAK